ncbi:hypothetical protein AALP_AA8G080200 [Arabis alpina]|uniref:Uncharacterized protein n=1 Tax=Arabis alpina TaxID=50452 RepID=A0A087G5P7_ARAAL|nr:hypothetical protein AALP_AA8G080200 [Arabis alpina]
MKKTTKLAPLFLSLLHIILLCLSFQVHVTEARILLVDKAPPPPYRPPPPQYRATPSPPCGSNIGSQVHVTEARDLLVVDEAPPPRPTLKPPIVLPPPCGSNIGSQVTTTREQSCRKIRRHHHGATPRPPRKN